MIIVRMAVAKFELTPTMPTFAKMAVMEANKAESKAYIHHIHFSLVPIYNLFSMYQPQKCR